MSREQLSEHESPGAAPARAEQQGDIQGLPPNLYNQAIRIGPGDAEGLRDLLTLFPGFAHQILAVVSSQGNLSTVKQAQALVQQNVTGQRNTLTSAQIHEGGEFAVEGSAPVLGPEPASQDQAAPPAAVDGARPLSKAEQREILHDPSDPKPLSKAELRPILHDASDPKPLSKAEQREILHDASDPKPLSKTDLGQILNDPSDPYHPAPDDLLSASKVEDARAFNAAHADFVATFNKLTQNVYCGESGDLDPQTVAAWQSRRNLEVDGKVGPHTLAAAKAASKNHTEFVAEGQPNPQPTGDVPV